MSSKKQTGALKAEDVIQAVLLGDSFTDHLEPYCIDTPLSLLPLVTVPLIEYSLKYLETAGINECFIYLCQRPQAVKDYLSTCRWLRDDSTMTVHVQTAEDCLSLGDIMRDLDAKALIQSDFLLMSVNCITNIDILPIIKEHSERRKTVDRGSVMTLLYREADGDHRARQSEPELLLAADSQTGRVLHHQRLPPLAHGKVSLPLHIFQEFSAVELRYDLMDPHLCVCSPAVPQLFSDNFDFQTRDQFIKGIIVNEEIMGNTIYHKCPPRCYAAHINSLSTLEAVTTDVLDRWTYPAVPETMAPARSSLRCIQPRNVYRHKSTRLGSGTRLERSVSLGKDTQLGSNCQLVRSVVGAGCRLGCRVSLDGAQLGSGCQLGDDVTVTRAALAPGVRLGDGVRVLPGCVLGSGVTVEGPRTLEPGTLITAEPRTDEFDQDQQTEGPDSGLVGEKGRGVLFTREPAEEDPLTPAPRPWAQPPPDDWDTWSESGESDQSSLDQEREDGAFSPVLDDTKLFYSEVLDSLVRGFNEKIKSDNLILEVNSSKFAYNVTVQELNSLLTKAILSVPDHGQEEPLSAGAFFSRLQPVLTAFLPLLENYIKNPDSELTCLRAIETFSYEHDALCACLAKLLMLLYQKDILSETTILRWHSEQHPDSPDAVRVRKLVDPLVRWLEEAEEESDSEDNSD